MLKLTIAATVSIASLFSISSIANAESISNKLTRPTSIQARLYLLAKRSQSNKSNISKEDIEGIRKVITDVYGSRNQSLSGSTGGGSVRFSVVKSLKLVSFFNSDAEINAEVEHSIYEGKVHEGERTPYAYKKNESRIVVAKIKLKKTGAKWQIWLYD